MQVYPMRQLHYTMPVPFNIRNVLLLIALLLVTPPRLPLPPDGLALEAAAGVPITYGTSHLALVHRARLQAGQTLLVLGASGGVGTTAVQVCGGEGRGGGVDLAESNMLGLDARSSWMWAGVVPLSLAGRDG